MSVHNPNETIGEAAQDEENHAVLPYSLSELKELQKKYPLGCMNAKLVEDILSILEPNCSGTKTLN